MKALVVLVVLFLLGAGICEAGRKSWPKTKLFVGYFQSWSETGSGATSGLAKTKTSYNLVNLAFMRPDNTYSSTADISEATTGLQFPYDGASLKSAIAELRTRNPEVLIFVSVGGSSYTNWGALAASNVAKFVKDFELDGVDIDYEPPNPDCTEGASGVSCASDSQYASVVQAIRNVLPQSSYRISIAAWSVGAYGAGRWTNAPPTRSPYTGLAINLLKNHGALLDLINVMSYDAGDSYNPEQALQAYAHYFTGHISMGIETPPEDYSDHVYTTRQVKKLVEAVNAKCEWGIMLWSIQKQPPKGTSIGPNYPNGALITSTVVSNFDNAKCS